MWLRIMDRVQTIRIIRCQRHELPLRRYRVIVSSLDLLELLRSDWMNANDGESHRQFMLLPDGSCGLPSVGTAHLESDQRLMLELTNDVELMAHMLYTSAYSENGHPGGWFDSKIILRVSCLKCRHVSTHVRMSPQHIGP